MAGVEEALEQIINQVSIDQGSSRFPVEQRTDKFVQPFHTELEEFNTVFIKAQMGMGKSTSLKNTMKALLNKMLAKGSGPLRVLYLGSKVAFDVNLKRELENCGIEVDLYYEEFAEGNYSSEQLILQMESLKKLARSAKFDVAVIDESESCLKCFGSKTMEGRLHDCVLTFERVVKTVKYTVWMDAFLGERSVACAENMGLRGITLNYTHQPFDRKAIEVKKKEDFFETIHIKLALGKKVMVVMTSKTSGDKFAETLKEKNVRFLFYNSDMPSEVRDTIKDPNRFWPQCALVMMTPSITVGINCDVEHFDYLFVYGSPDSCCVRDVFQTTLRARKIKENTMYYFLAPPFNYIQRPTTIRSVRRALNEHTELTSGHRAWPEAPYWLQGVMEWNILEDNISKNKYPSEFHKYLTMCGYTHAADVGESDIAPDIAALLGDAAQDAPTRFSTQYEDVRSVCKEEYETIRKRIIKRDPVGDDIWVAMKHEYDTSPMLVPLGKRNAETNKKVFDVWKDRTKGGYGRIRDLYWEKRGSAEDADVQDFRRSSYRPYSQALALKVTILNDIKKLLGVPSQDLLVEKTVKYAEMGPFATFMLDNARDLASLFKFKHEDKWGMLASLCKVHDAGAPPAPLTCLDCENLRRKRVNSAKEIFNRVFQAWGFAKMETADLRSRQRIKGKSVDMGDYKIITDEKFAFLSLREIGMMVQASDSQHFTEAELVEMEPKRLRSDGCDGE